MRLYSGKHHRAGFNYQIICTLDGDTPGDHRLCDWDTPRRFCVPVPRPQSVHRPERRHSRIRDIKDSDSSPPPRSRLEENSPRPTKHLNCKINHHRVIIERVIAHIKYWRVLSYTYRRTLTLYQRVFSIGRAVFLLRDNY